MHSRASSLLATIATLREDPAGGAVLGRGDGSSIPCTLSPSFGEVLAELRSGRSAMVTASPAAGEPCELTVVLLPGGHRTLLGVDQRSLEGAFSEPIENLVNQIAHDVRNHAFTIGLQSEMGARRSGGTPEVRAHFDAILRQVDSLKHYLEQLLRFGRAVAVRPVQVDPGAFVREQVQRYLYGRDAAAPPATIRVEAQDAMRGARWDPDRLGWALQALLDNAVRSASPPPPVVVALEATPESAVIEVRDAGAGIAPEILARLAMPMSVRRAGGAGLGLAIARKMAEAHQGRLELKSGPNGTVARLVVPWEAVPG